MDNLKENVMTCGIIQDLLPVYCDGQACDDSKREVERHLEECASCKEIYEDMIFEDEILGACDGEINTEIDVLKKVRFRNRLKVISGVLAGIAVCAVLFVVLFVGVIPVRSDEIVVTYKAHMDTLEVTNEKGEIEMEDLYCVTFDFELTNDKVLDCRSYDKGAIKLYSQLKLPFDDRGEDPNQFRYGMESTEPFTQEDVVVIQYRDKTVTYNLKELAEEGQIQ